MKDRIKAIRRSVQIINQVMTDLKMRHPEFEMETYL